MRTFFGTITLVIAVNIGPGVCAEDLCIPSPSLQRTVLKGEIVRLDLLCQVGNESLEIDAIPVLMVEACGTEFSHRGWRAIGEGKTHDGPRAVGEVPARGTFALCSFWISTAEVPEGCSTLKTRMLMETSKGFAREVARADLDVIRPTSVSDRHILERYQEYCRTVNCDGFDAVAFEKMEMARIRASLFDSRFDSLQTHAATEAEVWREIEDQMHSQNADSLIYRRALRRERCEISVDEYRWLLSGKGHDFRLDGGRALELLGADYYFGFCTPLETEALVKQVLHTKQTDGFQQNDSLFSSVAPPEWSRLMADLLNKRAVPD